MKNRKYELRYLPIFYDDLNKVIGYIGNKLRNPQAAEKLLQQVENAIIDRSDCAEAFEPYQSSRDRKHPYYTIYINNYVVYYAVIDHRVMEMRRFLYKGQNRHDIV